MVKLAIERDDLAADLFQNLRREGAGGAVAAGADHLEAALEFRPIGEVGDIARRKVLDEGVAAAGLHFVLAAEHDVLEPAHLVGAEGERAVRSHLHAGPAVIVVRGGDHGDAGHVEVKLGEIGHRGHREPDVVHPAAGRHEAVCERHLDRRRIGAEIVTGNDVRPHPEFVDQRAEAEPQRLDTHQVDLAAEQPARIVFAKAGGLHHRLGLVGIGIGLELRFGLGKHSDLAGTGSGAAIA